MSEPPSPGIPPSNLAVTLRIKVRPNLVGKMRVIAHDLTTASRHEDGCLFYTISQSKEDESLFLISMIWRDEESYRKHAESPYVRAFGHEIARELLEKRVVKQLWHALG